MKLYVLPTQKACDGICSFCITKFRKVSSKTFLDLNPLAEWLNRLKVDKIELTGGGEPTLHPNISEIISCCAAKAPTNMYTHGAHLKKIENVEKLSTLCVSIAHYDMKKNKQIMGVCPDLEFIRSLSIPVKFSLLLHRSGIHDKEGLLRYLQWASGFAQRVVVRQIFEYDYGSALSGEFVSTQKMFDELEIESRSVTRQGNPVFSVGKLEVEMELRSCACEMNNPVLHADGKLYQGWSRDPYDSDRK